MKPITVYTCITNRKDNLQNVQREEGVKYVCFTDQHFKHPVWESHLIDGLGLIDHRRIARRYKALSHFYTDTFISVWIDGRVKINGSVRKLVDTYQNDLVIRPHHARSCIYEEANEVIRIKFDDQRIVNRQMDYLNQKGYPQNNGLHETGIMIRRHTPEVIRFNEKLWAMLSTFSKRDQLAVDYVAWELDMKIQDMDRNEVTVGRHNKKTTIAE